MFVAYFFPYAVKICKQCGNVSKPKNKEKYVITFTLFLGLG